MDSEDSNGAHVQSQLSAPVPWIGMYVAAASLICTLQMAADVVFGLQIKKYWFPSKYFSLNAMSLMLLAVAMKLPVDLTTRMYTITDRLAKVSSLAFMSTSMANFLTSLGSMSCQETLSNVSALGILVITIVVNVSIQVIELQSFLDGRLVFAEEMLVMSCMLVLFVICGSLALMLSFTKQYLEMKYHDMHKSTLKIEEEEIWRSGRVATGKLRSLVKKYWIMEETSCPQFLILRTATCTLSGVVSLLILIVLIVAQIRMGRDYNVYNESNSDYGWSTKWILIIQTIGVIVGTIAPTSRLFFAIRFGFSTKRTDEIKSLFRVEEYWTQKIVEWKQSSIISEIRHVRSRRILHTTKGLILNLCIYVQTFIVTASKLILLIFVCISRPFRTFFSFIRRPKLGKLIPDTTATSIFDTGSYVMLLEGEAELPREILHNICNEVDKFIEIGTTRKPQYLFKSIFKSCNFKGVIEFDSHRVPNLHSHELPYCWSLPIVTLTSIAIALPNVENIKRKTLLRSVAEGLSYTKRIDNRFDRKGILSNIRKAADVVWVGVELHSMWHDQDLNETSLMGVNSKEVLQDLSKKAGSCVLKFIKDTPDSISRNPINWPDKVIAANAMYRISKTLLLVCDVESDERDDVLFDRISAMIADILSACLINIPHVITIECYRPVIEERVRSVREAALLVGETEDILALLQQREIPELNPDQASCIEHWRSLIKLEINKIP